VNDFFIRTSDEGHKRYVQGFLQRIYDNGDVYEDVYSGWYCVGCEAFKTEAELVDGRCPDHGTEPEWLEEKNWFFRLSAYQDRLLELYDERPDFVLPSIRYNEARSFIAGGLRDFSISRSTQKWGVPIPWDPKQVAYVWADALVNYRSALSYAPGENLERFWPAVHLLAKDILRFHCVYWPALLLSAGEEPPKQLFVHGYLNFDNRKMSKSLGNVIDPLELIDVYGADAVRFYAARVTNFGQDGNVSVDDVRERYERELANDLGNLVSRTTAMIARYRDGVLEQTDADPPWDLDGLREKLVSALDRFEITNALDEIWLFVRRLNQYVEESAPWQLAKDETRSAELTAVLYNLADGLTAIAVALAPYLPDSAPRILAALGQPAEDLSLERIRSRTAVPAEGIEPATPLFPRVELPAAAP
jgi:methionyl-tRNA synthetase